MIAISSHTTQSFSELMNIVKLRSARAEDMKLVLCWRNLPEIVELGALRETVTWSEHESWFSKMIVSDECLLLIIELAGEPAGQVRFEREGDRCYVSIYLVPPHTGKGYGVFALRLGCCEAFARWQVGRVFARIRPENKISIKAFQRAGFVADTTPHATNYLTDLFCFSRPETVMHNRLTYGDEEENAVVSTIRSGQWAMGSKVERLEGVLASAAECSSAVCVGSGLAALRLALLGVGVGLGDHVLVPAYSCVALANACLALGAIPVPVDVEDKNWNIDPEQVGDACRRHNPKAIIAVNTFGVPAPIEKLMEFGVPIIEDCAHAFGLTVGGRRLGSRGHVAILSFYATKLIGAGEGGAVLTNCEELTAKVRAWRDYVDKPMDAMRLNDKMTDITAAIACCQLERLPQMLAKRNKLAQRYDDLLKAIAGSRMKFRLPTHGDERVWYRYIVELEDRKACDVSKAMQAYGVFAEVPIEDWRPVGVENPVASHAYERLLSLPLYPRLTDEEQERVIHAFVSSC